MPLAVTAAAGLYEASLAAGGPRCGQTARMTGPELTLGWLPAS